MIKLFKSKQFLLFLFSGGTAAFVNFTSRILYNERFSFSTSIILAYGTGLVTAFILMKLFVFRRSTQSMAKSSCFFVLVNLFAVMQTWLISIVLANYLLPYLKIVLFSREIAHFFGVLMPIFTSYLGHKYYSFRE